MSSLKNKLGTSRETRSAKSLVGVVLNQKYKIIELLGSGGMGQVYKAVHLTLDRIVAIKVIHAETDSNKRDELCSRFQREARLAAKIDHPHVVPVYDYGLFRESAFLVMKFIDGRTLQDELEQVGPLEIGRAATLCRQLCSALEVAHRNGIVHRDLKPANIMLTVLPSGKESAVVLDFGIAKILAPHGENLTTITDTGAIIGTPRYMSPEQIKGEQVDPRSDIYSAALIVYQMISGRFPFPANGTLEFIMAHLRDKPVPLRSQPGMDVPFLLDRVILRALSKDPGLRQQSISDFSEGLQAAFGIQQQTSWHAVFRYWRRFSQSLKLRTTVWRAREYLAQWVASYRELPNQTRKLLLAALGVALFSLLYVLLLWQLSSAPAPMSAAGDELIWFGEQGPGDPATTGPAAAENWVPF